MLVFYEGLNAAIIGLLASGREKAAGNLIHVSMISDTFTAFMAFPTRISACTWKFIGTICHNISPLNYLCIFANYLNNCKLNQFNKPIAKSLIIHICMHSIIDMIHCNSL